MLARPIQLQIERQRPLMVSGIGESSEAHQLGTRALQREAQLVAFVQIALHGGLYRVGAVHATLPGQGIATAASRPMSTLA